MHALTITFTTSNQPEALDAAMHSFADALAHVDGLITKVWLRNGSRLGGFYVFTDADAAAAYVASPLVAALRDDPAHSDFIVATYEVLEALSRRTGLTRSGVQGQ